MSGAVAVLVAVAIGLAAYVGYGTGQLDGWSERSRYAEEAQSKQEWVEIMMRPLWTDYCAWFPEKCRCAPIR